MATIRKKKVIPLTPEANVSFALEDVLRLGERQGVTLFPLDIKSLIRMFNISLEFMILDNEISGYLEKGGDGWLIVINRLHHPRRQRFTMAHELGHYILHRKQQNKFVDEKLFRGVSQNSMETEANRFAAEILMPEPSFREKAGSGMGPEALSEAFEVSSQAVKVRASQLSIDI